MTNKEAIEYQQPVADNTPLSGYGAALTAAIYALHQVEEGAVKVVHGRWIGLEYDGYADGCPVYDLWECSECGVEVRGEDVPNTHLWCHGCGAKMDAEGRR